MGFGWSRARFRARRGFGLRGSSWARVGKVEEGIASNLDWDSHGGLPGGGTVKAVADRLRWWGSCR